MPYTDYYTDYDYEYYPPPDSLVAPIAPFFIRDLETSKGFSPKCYICDSNGSYLHNDLEWRTYCGNNGFYSTVEEARRILSIWEHNNTLGENALEN